MSEVLEQMERKTKALLFVMGTFDNLMQVGLIEGSPMPFTKSGREALEKLRADGFTPTDEEVAECAAFIMGGGLSS